MMTQNILCLIIVSATIEVLLLHSWLRRAHNTMMAASFSLSPTLQPAKKRDVRYFVVLIPTYVTYPQKGQSHRRLHTRIEHEATYDEGKALGRCNAHMLLF